MTLMRMYELLQQNNINLTYDPGYYGGRGENLDDLNSPILAQIHAVILKEFGDEAAKNFALMVEELDNLSASNFLAALRNLELRNWQWNPAAIPTVKQRTYVDNRDAAWGTVMSAFMREKRSRVKLTDEIRNPFLQSLKNTGNHARQDLEI